MRQVYYQVAGGVVVHNGQVLLLDHPGRGEVRGLDWQKPGLAVTHRTPDGTNFA
jgi:hypothetical protein